MSFVFNDSGANYELEGVDALEAAQKHFNELLTHSKIQNLNLANTSVGDGLETTYETIDPTDESDDFFEENNKKGEREKQQVKFFSAPEIGVERIIFDKIGYVQGDEIRNPSLKVNTYIGLRKMDDGSEVFGIYFNYLLNRKSLDGSITIDPEEGKVLKSTNIQDIPMRLTWKNEKLTVEICEDQSLDNEPQDGFKPTMRLIFDLNSRNLSSLQDYTFREERLPFSTSIQEIKE